MHNLAMGLTYWFAASVLFGLFWVFTASAMKEARRRWPHMATDQTWRSSGRRGPAARRSHLAG